MDPISGGLAATALVKLGPTAGRLLERAAGPAVDELGEWMRDKVRAYRYRNTEVVTTRADEKLRAAGGEIHEVPFSILLPLLEAASLEDHHEMQEYWSSLLANAAGGYAVAPVFTRILEALSPLDARVLQICAELDAAARQEHAGNLNIEGYVVARNQIVEGASISSPLELEVSLDTLASLRLVEPEPALYPLEPQSPANAELRVRMTALGRSFVRAVTAPTAADTAA